jgi:hypothetical protein
MHISDAAPGIPALIYLSFLHLPRLDCWQNLQHLNNAITQDLLICLKKKLIKTGRLGHNRKRFFEGLKRLITILYQILKSCFFQSPEMQ